MTAQVCCQRHVVDFTEFCQWQPSEEVKAETLRDITTLRAMSWESVQECLPEDVMAMLEEPQWAATGWHVELELREQAQLCL